MSEPTSSSLQVPEEITFQQAIEVTQRLMTQLEQGDLAEAEAASTIAQLVRSENGARGFFVTYLTDDRSIADHPSPQLVEALQSSPEIVSELLVKNVAMSTGMAITHRRNQNAEMAQGSDRVRRRTVQLIELAQLPTVVEKAQKLYESTVTGQGEYQAFLDRWQYDAEQRQAIQNAMKQVVA
jgi:hypothetical protein